MIQICSTEPRFWPRLRYDTPSLRQINGFRTLCRLFFAPEGDAKLINPITLENIADAILQDGLATRQEIDALIHELYAFAADPRTVAGLARDPGVGAAAGGLVHGIVFPDRLRLSLARLSTVIYNHRTES